MVDGKIGEAEPGGRQVNAGLCLGIQYRVTEYSVVSSDWWLVGSQQ